MFPEVPVVKNMLPAVPAVKDLLPAVPAVPAVKDWTRLSNKVK